MAGDITSPIWLTVKLAALTVAILLVLCTPLAWWLSRTSCRLKPMIEAVVTLPLVLPPTVLGFYLMLSMGPHGPMGQLWAFLGLGPLTFTFTGLVIASLFYSLPFVVQPLQNAFTAMGKKPMEAAACLGASPLDAFFSIAIPLALRGYLSALVLGFAHTLGEFGVVLMVGGNIPGETRVLSIAIYEYVETLNYSAAHWLSGGLLAFSFLVLSALYMLNRPPMLNRSRESGKASVMPKGAGK